MASGNKGRKVLTPGDLVRSYRWFNWDVRRLLLAGVLDGLGRQPMWFVLPLYLEALHYGLDVIGYVIFVFGVSSTLPMMPIGYLGDRFGRKRMMLVGLLISAIGLAMFVFSDDLMFIVVAVAVSGFGGAMTGSCFMALLAEKVEERQRKYLFSLQGLVAMLASAGMVFTIGFLSPWYAETYGGGLAQGDRFIFSLGFVAISLEMVVLTTVPERQKAGLKMKGRAWAMPWSTVADADFRDDDGKEANDAREEQRRARKEKEEFDRNIPWGTIARLSAPMAFLGLGAGFIVNFFQNFFSMRFGTPMAVIGLLFGMTNLIWAASYLFMPILAERIGSIRAIFLTEVIAILALIAIPISGNFYITAAMYTLRMVLMNSSWPVWSAYAINAAGERYSATTMATTQTCFNGLRSITPVIAGHVYMMSWDLPFFICAAFYVGASSLTFAFFWDRDDGPWLKKRGIRKGRKEGRREKLGRDGGPLCDDARQPGL